MILYHMAEVPAMVINGQVVREGTAFFDTRTDEVLWFHRLSDEGVELETVADTEVRDKATFVRAIYDGDVEIEAGPFGYVEMSP